MKHKSLAQETCPISRGLNVIGEWWTLLIVREAFYGVTKFADFQSKLGIAKNILAARLKQLVKDGILQLDNKGGKRSQYVLTEKGRDLIYVLLAISQWASKWLFTSGRPSLHIVDKQDLLEIAPLEVRSRNGRILGTNDIEFLHEDKRSSKNQSSD
jgi:DNA-binding HxlR family transcriptional regulator